MAKPLTPRELAVLRLLATGSSVRWISDALDIAERSVEAHFQMIAEKLGATNTMQAVAIALRDQIIPPIGKEG